MKAEKVTGKGVRKVAVARFSALGDVAMTIPVLYSACASNEDVHFVMLTRKAFAGVFVNAPANLEVRGLDLKGEYRGTRGMLRLARSVDADVLIDLHDVLRTWILGAGMRVKGVRTVRFDKARDAKKRLVRAGAEGSVPVTPTMERYADAFLAAGLRYEPTFKGLYADKKADTSLFGAVSGAKKAGERWVGIAPFAAHAGKVWPEELMLDTVHTLSMDKSLKIFLFGGGAVETATLTKWAGDADNTVCVAGSGIGFGGELALMSELDVMLAMDSGNMHLAAIAGAPTVSIWGATHPAAGFMAWNSDARYCLGAALKCRPCSVFGDKECRRGDYECLRQVSAETVLEALGEKLSESFHTKTEK